MQKSSVKTPLRVAVGQTSPHVGEKARNMEEALTLVEAAAKSHVDVLVLPELGNSGYAFESRAEAFELSESIPSGPTCKTYLNAVRNSNTFVVAGICERDGRRLYNTAIVVGPDGFVGKYRKLHLWNEEKLFFEPGNLGLPVFRLPFGRLGVMICYDAWFPETARVLKLQGADIICDPTCWDLDPKRIEDDEVRVYVHVAQAHMNNVFIACADRVGVERGYTFAGRSCIVGPRGFVVGPGSSERSELLTAEINLVEARHHHWNAFSDPIADRRTDVYATDLGYCGVDQRRRPASGAETNQG
jgi:N-carbamoylputrescine amidase